MRPSLVVVAKAPRRGRSKTRLCPPCTQEQAAALAEAALLDTLDAATRCRAGRRVVLLDGEAGSWLPRGFEIVPQQGRDLDQRLASGVQDVGDAAVLIGMDTPQVTPDLLDLALDGLRHADATLGEAEDGGYWAIGLRRPDPLAFLGVPMSTRHTAAAQRARLRCLGLSIRELPVLRDVDDIGDAVSVAEAAPETRFAVRLAGMQLQ